MVTSASSLIPMEEIHRNMAPPGFSSFAELGSGHPLPMER
jgi:hypothetical protein